MSKLLATVGVTLLLASAEAPPAKTDAKPSGGAQQYCLKFADDTGSHLARTECRTKREWKQLGVDVDELTSKNSGGGGLA